MRLIETRRWRMLSALVSVAICAALIWSVEDNPSKPTFHQNRGKIFGTYYSIQYEGTKDLEDSIQAAFTAFDKSLSMFNPQSVLSAINHNRDTATDAAFETMWSEAEQVYQLSNGAFDITVAPLVNLWGFGLKHREQVKEAQVDSARALVGFDKVRLENHRVVKADERMMLDAGAVAKGQSCDMIAALLERQGCENYLVEIGGEIVSKGQNSKGQKWRVGITKPTEQLEGDNLQSELQDIIEVNNICMATSGNYRNFYYEGKQKRSHTIDPRTGYPVLHSLLSATVVSNSCMRADALATACMVLGQDGALDMIARAGNAACYLIIADNDSIKVIVSPNWDNMLQ